MSEILSPMKPKVGKRIITSHKIVTASCSTKGQLHKVQINVNGFERTVVWVVFEVGCFTGLRAAHASRCRLLVTHQDHHSLLAQVRPHIVVQVVPLTHLDPSCASCSCLSWACQGRPCMAVELSWLFTCSLLYKCSECTA